MAGFCVFHNVPLYTQAMSWACWYTAFEMVVGYERSRDSSCRLLHPSENGFAQSLYDANQGIGKDATEREVVARALGFDCIYASMSTEGMLDLLGYAPVIYAGHWPGKPFGHWVVLIGIAGARTWIRKPMGTRMRLWFTQMVLNFLWSPIFFGMQSPAGALVIIVPMLICIVAFMALTYRRDRISMWLFVPYAVWVAFATVLNASIGMLN